MCNFPVGVMLMFACFPTSKWMDGASSGLHRIVAAARRSELGTYIVVHVMNTPLIQTIYT